MQDNRMQAVPIDQVMNGAQVPIDYYLRLSANKYILVAKAATNVPLETLQKYKAKNVDRLYCLIEDYLRLLQGVIQGASVAVQVKSASSQAKMNVIKDAMSAVYNESSALGFNEQTYSHAKLVNHATLTFISTEPKFEELIAKLAGVRDSSGSGVKHAMMVSMIATMIGIAHDWTKPATLEKLALGGFLHDIGKTKLPLEVVMRPREQMSRDDKVIYKSHADVGHQILSSVKSVPEDVALIVLQHHELADGTGFPRAIRDLQISPLARVVALANAFTEIVDHDRGEIGPTTAEKALETLEFKRHMHFNRDAMKALRKLVVGMNAKVA